ncbi:Arc family DNA-binding protein [Kiloniella sp.]|uniref:Arc family DNA-binding protein n=1 Tax=Kiloniella sp. TaxID=1938587 RepID=UPI003B024902
MTSDCIARTIRLPETLAELIEASRVLNRRSANAEMVYRLERSFDRPTGQQDLPPSEPRLTEVDELTSLKSVR